MMNKEREEKLDTNHEEVKTEKKVVEGKKSNEHLETLMKEVEQLPTMEAEIRITAQSQVLRGIQGTQASIRLL